MFPDFQRLDLRDISMRDEEWNWLGRLAGIQKCWPSCRCNPVKKWQSYRSGSRSSYNEMLASDRQDNLFEIPSCRKRLAQAHTYSLPGKFELQRVFGTSSWSSRFPNRFHTFSEAKTPQAKLNASNEPVVRAFVKQLRDCRGLTFR